MKRTFDRLAPLILAAIVAGAAGLALYWVFLIPILQAPDEPNHLSTALNIYSARKLISVREPLHRWNSNQAGDHVYVSYLKEATNTDALIFHYSVKVPPGYGTREYYKAIDRDAPGEESGGLDGKRRLQYGMLTTYPCGYYVALAIWLWIAALFSGKVTALFFAARGFSVLLLAVNLSLMYATLRELKLGSMRALLLTAIVGFFPMTTFVSSYVQADNFTLMTVLLSCYVAVRMTRAFVTKNLVLLGSALTGLCLSKYHFFAAVLIAVSGLVISENLARHSRVAWWKISAVLLGPVVIGALVHIWITAGSDPNLVLLNQSTAHTELNQAMARGKFTTVAYLIKGLGFAFSNFYLNGHTALTGSTFNSFWGDFGWTDTPLIIFTPWKTNIIRNVIAIFCVVIFALTIVRLCQVARRLIRIARRRRASRALCILFSNPLLNGYYIFTTMMFGLFMIARRSYGPQGRNWFPFILAIFLNAVIYAPRAIRRLRISAVISWGLMAGLGAYCVLGSIYAIPSVWNRFYDPLSVPPPYSLQMPVPEIETPVMNALSLSRYTCQTRHRSRTDSCRVSALKPGA